MKKFLGLFMIAMTMLLVTSCGMKPNFEFKTEVTCKVFDPKSNVTFVMPTSVVTNLSIVEPAQIMLMTTKSISDSILQDSAQTGVLTAEYIVNANMQADTTLIKLTDNPTQSQIQEADDFVSDFIKTNIVKQFPKQTQYTIKLKGYVRETMSGVVIAIDKEITNIQNL